MTEPTAAMDTDPPAPAWPNLPASVNELAGVIGIANALALASAWGGLTLKVPASHYDGVTRAWLIERIGAEATVALIERYKGERLYIPRCVVALRDARDSEIIRAYDAGTPAPALARAHRLTERQVRAILKRTPEDAAEVAQAVQAGLF